MKKILLIASILMILFVLMVLTISFLSIGNIGGDDSIESIELKGEEKNGIITLKMDGDVEDELKGEMNPDFKHFTVKSEDVTATDISFIDSAYASKSSKRKIINVPTSLPQTGIIDDFTPYYGNWKWGWDSAKVFSLWKKSGRTHNRKIATINKNYLVAVRPVFGKVGDSITVVLKDGTKFDCIIADQKGSDANHKWGHVKGGGKVSLVEWEDVKWGSDLKDWKGKKVKQIINNGKYKGGFGSNGNGFIDEGTEFKGKITNNEEVKIEGIVNGCPIVGQGTFIEDEKTRKKKKLKTYHKINISAGSLSEGGATFSGSIEKLYFCQYRKPYRDAKYASYVTLGTGGCGCCAVTCAIIIQTGKKLTPIDVAKKMRQKMGDSFYCNGAGTYHGVLGKVAGWYGCKYKYNIKSVSAMKKVLEKGSSVVCAAGGSVFVGQDGQMYTSGGHYICFWKYSKGYYYAKDSTGRTGKMGPACKYSTTQMKNFLNASGEQIVISK